jgi:DNA recombination protein RmuC
MLTAVISILSAALILAVVLLVLSKLNKLEQKNSSIEFVQKEMEGFRQQVTTQVGQISQQVNKLYSDNLQTLQNVDRNVNARLDNAAKVISDVHRRLGEVHETSKQVQEVGKDIASLQEILKAPKIRGGMGELLLSDLLKQILPSAHYQLQYRFKSREIVDAVILLKDLIIPIDSKFPLENFKKIVEAKTDSERNSARRMFVRDIKKHIDDIRSKYILPDEGTANFALMYIPAENVYYEIIVKDENLDAEKGVFKYSLENRIFPVSPNSFYGYLQTILFGLRGMRIEEQAQEILRNIARLEGDFSRVIEDFQKMGTHLKNLSGSYDATDKRLGKFGDKLQSLETKHEALSPAKLKD